MPAFDVEQILLDPETSPWLRTALTAALERDPIDAAADAAVLVKVLDARVAAVLHEELRAEPVESPRHRPVAA